MGRYDAFDAALAQARAISAGRRANFNAAARYSNTTRQYGAMAARARSGNKSGGGGSGGGGGSKGLLDDIMESPVGKVLKAVDLGRSYVASHVSDTAQELEKGDYLGALDASLRTLPGYGIVGEGIDAAQGRKVDFGQAFNSYRNEQNRKDMWAHTGVGTYLQRGLDKHTWDDGSWSENPLGHLLNTRPARIGVGLAGDVGLDPLTYLTGGSEKLAGGAAKVAERVATEGVENAVKALGEEAGQKFAREAALRVQEKGASTLSAKEIKILFPGERGGLAFRVPGTGRLGRKFTGVKEEELLHLLPKQLTRPIERLGAIPKSALRNSEFTGKVLSKFGGEFPEARQWIKSGDFDKMMSGYELKNFGRTRRALENAGFRLNADNALGLTEGAAGRGQLGVKASDAWKSVTKDLSADELKAAVAAVESAKTPAQLAAVKGAEQIKTLMHDVYDAMKTRGMHVDELDNYFPRIVTDEARQKYGLARGVGGNGSVKGGFENARTIRPNGEETNWSLRDFMNKAAEEQGLPKGFYEKDPHQTMSAYLTQVNKRMAHQGALNELVANGTRSGAVDVGFLENAVKNAKSQTEIKKRLGQLLTGVSKNARAAQAARAAAADADGGLQAVIRDLASQGLTPDEIMGALRGDLQGIIDGSGAAGSVADATAGAGDAAAAFAGEADAITLSPGAQSIKDSLAAEAAHQVKVYNAQPTFVETMNKLTSAQNQGLLTRAEADVILDALVERGVVEPSAVGIKAREFSSTGTPTGEWYKGYVDPAASEVAGVGEVPKGWPAGRARTMPGSKGFPGTNLGDNGIYFSPDEASGLPASKPVIGQTKAAPDPRVELRYTQSLKARPEETGVNFTNTLDQAAAAGDQPMERIIEARKVHENLFFHNARLEPQYGVPTKHDLLSFVYEIDDAIQRSQHLLADPELAAGYDRMLERLDSYVKNPSRSNYEALDAAAEYRVLSRIHEIGAGGKAAYTETAKARMAAWDAAMKGGAQKVETTAANASSVSDVIGKLLDDPGRDALQMGTDAQYEQYLRKIRGAADIIERLGVPELSDNIVQRADENLRAFLGGNKNAYGDTEALLNDLQAASEGLSQGDYQALAARAEDTAPKVSHMVTVKHVENLGPKFVFGDDPRIVDRFALADNFYQSEIARQSGSIPLVLDRIAATGPSPVVRDAAQTMFDALQSGEAGVAAAERSGQVAPELAATADRINKADATLQRYLEGAFGPNWRAKISVEPGQADSVFLQNIAGRDSAGFPNGPRPGKGVAGFTAFAPDESAYTSGYAKAYEAALERGTPNQVRRAEENLLRDLQTQLFKAQEAGNEGAAAQLRQQIYELEQNAASGLRTPKIVDASSTKDLRPNADGIIDSIDLNAGIAAERAARGGEYTGFGQGQGLVNPNSEVGATFGNELFRGQTVEEVRSEIANMRFDIARSNARGEVALQDLQAKILNLGPEDGQAYLSAWQLGNTQPGDLELFQRSVENSVKTGERTPEEARLVLNGFKDGASRPQGYLDEALNDPVRQQLQDPRVYADLSPSEQAAAIDRAGTYAVRVRDAIANGDDLTPFRNELLDMYEARVNADIRTDPKSLRGQALKQLNAEEADMSRRLGPVTDKELKGAQRVRSEVVPERGTTMPKMGRPAKGAEGAYKPVSGVPLFPENERMVRVLRDLGSVGEPSAKDLRTMLQEIGDQDPIDAALRDVASQEPVTGAQNVPAEAGRSAMDSANAVNDSAAAAMEELDSILQQIDEAGPSLSAADRQAAIDRIGQLTMEFNGESANILDQVGPQLEAGMASEAAPEPVVPEVAAGGSGAEPPADVPPTTGGMPEEPPGGQDPVSQHYEQQSMSFDENVTAASTPAAPRAAKTKAADQGYMDAMAILEEARSAHAAITPEALTAAQKQGDDFLSVVERQLADPNVRSPKVRASLEQARDLLIEHNNAMAAAGQAQDAASAQALRFQADAAKAEAALHATQQWIDVHTKAWSLAQTPQAQKQIMQDLLDGALQQFRNTDIAAPREMAQVIEKVQQMNTPEGMRKFFSYWDRAVSYLKGWQVATPGFHVRNAFGGTVNNFIGDVEFGAMTSFRRSYKAWKAGTISAEEGERMAQLVQHLGGGQYSFAELGRRAGSKYNPLSTNFAFTRGSAKVGEGVEFYLRGAMGWDRLSKGMTMSQALEDIIKFHFDYADLSPAERMLKRVVPFYSFARHNFPLQVEMFLAKPGKYSRFYQFKTELEAGTPEEGVVPNYFVNDLFGIRSPFKSGGNRMYITPDLPYTQTMASNLPDFKNFDPTRLNTYGSLTDNYTSQVTPLIKTPLELFRGRQFYKGIPMPRDYKGGDMPWGMDNAGGAAVGNFVGGNNKAAYALEQFFPLYGRARRLLPTEDKYKQRAASSQLSFFGVPVRTNTPTEKKTERLRRALKDK